MAPSPCVGICTDQDGICVGCYRTLDEIAEWPYLTAEGQLEVLERVRQRHEAG